MNTTINADDPEVARAIRDIQSEARILHKEMASIASEKRKEVVRLGLGISKVFAGHAELVCLVAMADVISSVLGRMEPGERVVMMTAITQAAIQMADIRDKIQ